jgi:predicted PurR-regulated permease PerM
MLAVLLALAAAAGVIWLLRTLSWLVAPVFFGLTMVVAVYPVFTGLVKRKVPRWLAATTMALVLVGLLAAGIYAVVWAVGAIVNAAPNYVPAVVTAWNSLLAWLVKLGVNSTTLNSLVTNFDPTRLLGAAGSLVTSLSGIIGMVTVVLASVLMMMIDTVGWDGRLGMAAQTHPRMVTALRGFASGVRQYWIVSSIFGAIMAGLNGLELLLLHVPLIGVWMLLTFVTTFIPNVGFFFAMIPAVLMALAATSWRNALLLMALYFITTWIVQGIFQPKYAGNAIGVNTTVSFLSFLLWAWVFGPLGALIALPLTQFVKSLLVDADPRARWLNALIAQPPNAEGAEQED